MRTMKSHVDDEKKSLTDWNGLSSAASKVQCGNALLLGGMARAAPAPRVRRPDPPAPQPRARARSAAPASPASA